MPWKDQLLVLWESPFSLKGSLKDKDSLNKPKRVYRVSVKNFTRSLKEKLLFIRIATINLLRISNKPKHIFSLFPMYFRARFC